ncbi:ADP/ATP translocase 2 [Sciurus carolinensis]|uniref:ADP/ATP translocase n=1 Tax=Sciurus carolinensis TaxID=30640 RepID=A0AA41N6E5_SCICA|nr:ADP/ATP translocase 2 [Sciurus carolinensis]
MNNGQLTRVITLNSTLSSSAIFPIIPMTVRCYLEATANQKYRLTELKPAWKNKYDHKKATIKSYRSQYGSYINMKDQVGVTHHLFFQHDRSIVSFSKDFLLVEWTQPSTRTWKCPRKSSSKQITAAKQHKGIMDCVDHILREQGVLSFWHVAWPMSSDTSPPRLSNFLQRKTQADIPGWCGKEDPVCQYFAGNLASGGAAGSTSLCFVHSAEFAQTSLAADVEKVGAEREFKGLHD